MAMKRSELLALAERIEKKWWAAPESDEIALAALAAFVRQIAEAQPVAAVTGYFGGQCVIAPMDPAAVIPANMALYTLPMED